jgi:hypothetical protein
MEWAGQQAALPATWALSPGKAVTLGCSLLDDVD